MMKTIVKKGNNMIAKARLLESRQELGKGLRFSKRLGKQDGIILKLPKETRFNAIIDMFFVFYPIDVIWLDKKKVVVDKKESMMPFAVKIPKRKAMYVLELPAGKARKIMEGDRLAFYS